MNTQLWHKPAVITRNNFVHKSLSSWALNFSVGCAHACRFCYVPDVSTNKMAGTLAAKGVKDPDAEWGDYVMVRPWDTNAFEASIRKAEAIPAAELNTDGNRAVMLCTTTDPYQTLPDKGMHDSLHLNVEHALHLLLRTTLNVRILTRSPLARQHFGLMRLFGKRLLFGMSIPTLRNDLAKVYEPKAPAPSQRLATLKAAKEAGLNIYAAMAPTYPECDTADLTETLTELSKLEPVTIFHEPINIRAENVKRIAEHAASLGVKLNTAVFDSAESWRRYAVGQLMQVAAVASSLGIKQMHLWPDKALGSKDCRKWAMANIHPNFDGWLNHWWSRVSEWPK